MTTESVNPKVRGAAHVSTIAEAFRRTAATHPDRVAVRTLNDEISLTWGALRERVDALAGGLARLGLRRGDTVAMLLSQRYEFHLIDLAAMTLAGTPFSLYQTLAPEQIRYVLQDAKPRLAFVDEAHVDRFLEASRSLPQDLPVIVVDGDGREGTLRIEDIETSGSDFDAEAAWRAVTPDDLLTLIYTSGTTGPPKGVQLTHRNLIAAARALEQIVQPPEAARVISWLPAAHIAERAAHHYLPIVFGFTITICPDPRELVSYLPQVRPHWFFAVPRVWEKLKAGLESQLASLPAEQRVAAHEALQASLEKVRLEQAGQAVSTELAERVAKADLELFSKLRALLGLDQVASVNVGAAPTPREVLEFFHALGIEVSELWGLSESAGLGTVNPPERIKLGTVGPPAPGVELKLEADGEVLLRGECVMVGYRNQPEKTAEAIDADGWLHTGDVGEIDEDGYLKIIDRKKELIINAAGKNMSPANIESTLKVASPLIGQVCLIGDARSYNTALIVPDPDFAVVWAKQNGLEGRSLSELVGEEQLIAAIQEGVDAANARLSRVEQIKKFTLIPSDWPPGGDELTPTMKLKRKPIAEKYAAEIEAMYAS